MDNIYSLDLKYTNEGQNSIGRDFIRPCLKECSLYRRHTAFFRISALDIWSSAFTHLIKENVKIELMTSMVVEDPGVIRALELNTTHEDRQYILSKCAQNIIFEAMGFDKDVKRRDKRQKLLNYLIANEQLEIRFALPKAPIESHANDPLFHVKEGYFRFDDAKNTVIGFSGSFNESYGGLESQYEKVNVYRSYKEGDIERLEDTVFNCDREWEGKSEYLEVFSLSKKTLKIIKDRAPKKRPFIPDVPDNPIDDLDIWQHKKDAIKEFLKQKNGILEMATGTGKTKTALEIVKQLILSKEISSIICTTNGNDLLYQWQEEFFLWQEDNMNTDISNLIIKKHFHTHHDIQDFLNDPSGRFLITSRNSKNLKKTFDNLSIDQKKKTLIIHDEIHRLGSDTLKESLPGGHSEFNYKLGLSATPEREYDQKGNDFIEKEIGSSIFKYPIENAIRDKVLCPFNYYPISYSLSAQEKLKKRDLIGDYNAKLGTSDAYPEEVLHQRLSKVNKLASSKPSLFKDFIDNNKELLDRSIIFVEEKSQGDLISNSIKNLVTDWTTYYEDSDSTYLDDFSEGDINTLIACGKVSEGIDIRDLKTVILISSNKSKLMTIQRIGRCIRTDPNNINKVANVVDLILDLDEPDEENSPLNIPADRLRCEWLKELSKVRPLDE